MSKLPIVPEVLKSDWDLASVNQVKVSLCPIDELGIPFDRRGVTAAAPRDRADFAKFASEMGKLVEDTILELLKRGTE